MLPRATSTRTSRERGQIGGRTQEIQRLIGRSVRAMLDDVIANIDAAPARNVWITRLTREQIMTLM